MLQYMNPNGLIIKTRGTNMKSHNTCTARGGLALLMLMATVANATHYDAKDRAKDAIERTSEQAGHVKERARQNAQKSKERAKEAADNAKKEAVDVKKRAERGWREGEKRAANENR